MEVLASFFIIVFFLATAHPLMDVPDDEIVLYPNTPGSNVALRYEVKPLSALKDENIIKQQFDYSCGSASLATLLNSYLGEKMTEQQVIQGLMAYGDAQAIAQRRAFSLLDMKQFVSVLGYQGAGFTAEIEDLKSLKKPCIVPIEFSGYKHFVVYRGMYGDHLFFADPYLGNISFTVTDFKQIWYRNIVFVVSSEQPTLNALQLREDDLRLVDFDMTKKAITNIVPGRSTILDDEHEYKESRGMYLYKRLNVY